MIRPRAAWLLCLAFLAWTGRAGAANPAAIAFDIPADAMPALLSSFGGGFENRWNAFLVAEIEATLAGDDSAAYWRGLERRVADAERPALGSTIAGDALRLRERWNPRELRMRVHAGESEAAAGAAQRSGQFDLADSLYEEALRDYRRLGEKRRLAWVWGSMGVAAFQSARFTRAESLYTQALAARRAIGDEAMIGNSLNALGTTQIRLGNLAEADRWYRQARAVRERIGQLAQLGQTLTYLGIVAEQSGRPDSALVWYHEALNLTVSQGDSVRTAEALINYARLLRVLGHGDDALAIYDRALSIAKQSGDLAKEGIILQNLGEILAASGRYSDAIERLQRSVELAQQAKHPYDELFALNTLGYSWLGVRDPARARPVLLRALALSDSMESQVLRAEVLNNLAMTSFEEGDTTGAERMGARALDEAKAIDNPDIDREILRTLGRVAFNRGDYAAAEDRFRRAAQAVPNLEPAARAGDRINVAAAILMQGRLDEAEQLMQNALDDADPDQRWGAALGLGDIEERRGNVPAALALCRSAASMIDTIRSRQDENRSITAFASRLFAYEALIHLLVKSDAQYPDSGFAAEAFGWAERARARGLLDLLATAHPRDRATGTLSLEQAQALVGPDDALLEYSVGDSSTTLWVITKERWSHFTLPPRPALHTRIAVLRRHLGRPDFATAPAALRSARALYSILVSNAEPLIRDKQHLIIVPDGALALVPFEALLTQEPEGNVVAKNSYLIQHWAVSYAPSASALAATRGASRGGGIVALGDPVFATPGGTNPHPELVPLPNTAAELAVIQQLAGPRDVDVLVGTQATRADLLAEPGLADAQLIHIATHGEANESDPSRSGLWLASDGEQGPGFLGVRDILGLDLHAALVTLSACETGLGRLERGEGVLGLPRAFMAAGARSVVVSLWKVNDQSTAMLMERFYRGLLKKGLPRSEALAAAKRQMLKKAETRSPYYWAPFILVGTDGRLR